MPHAPTPVAPVKPDSPAIPPGADPVDALARWPADVPVGAFLTLSETPAPDAPWARRSVFVPTARVPGVPGSLRSRALTPIQELRSAINDPRFHGVGATLGYELGRVLEPAAGHRVGDPGPPVDDRHHPTLTVHPAEGVLTWDSGTRAWTATGRVPVAARAREAAFEVTDFVPTSSARAFQRSVARAIEYIHAGDCFQVNLAHRLTARFAGAPRALGAHLMRAIRPSLGSYIESVHGDGSLARAVLSLSPELFLHVDGATGVVTTRPIKGTRAAADRAADLERSEKDGAELAMIVDLMRNDLGRVCAPGTIRVERARDVESFGRDPRSGVRHTVATITGTLAPGRTPIDLVEACFPPGSVTGAPKIRAMQIIEELEPVARGPYCGAIAWFDRSGDATLSVPIRTLVLTPDPGSTLEHATGTVDLHLGAGIVADSDPYREWIETLHKGATILAPLGQDALALDR